MRHKSSQINQCCLYLGEHYNYRLYACTSAYRNDSGEVDTGAKWLVMASENKSEATEFDYLNKAKYSYYVAYLYSLIGGTSDVGSTILFEAALRALELNLPNFKKELTQDTINELISMSKSNNLKPLKRFI